MPRADSWDVGVPAWVDVSTTDPAAARRFYRSLFGWDCEDRFDGDTLVYTMLRLHGRHAAGLGALPSDAAARGATPAGTTHIAVADTDVGRPRRRRPAGRGIARQRAEPGRVPAVEAQHRVHERVAVETVLTVPSEQGPVEPPCGGRIGCRYVDPCGYTDVPAVRPRHLGDLLLPRR